MTKFRLSMTFGGVEMVKYIEISEEELEPSYQLYDEARERYRKNVVNKHLEKWALSKLELTQWEVNTDV